MFKQVALSPLDAANVIQVGWGERFPLAGLLSFVPVGCELPVSFASDSRSTFLNRRSYFPLDVMICESLSVV